MMRLTVDMNVTNRSHASITLKWLEQQILKGKESGAGWAIELIHR